MKLLSIEQIREADRFTIENEPISGLELMERAASKAFDYIYNKYGEDKYYIVFAGPGNNGGDGIVLAILLTLKDCKVKLMMSNFNHKLSEDCQTNLERLTKLESECIRYINPDNTWEEMIPSEYENSKNLVIIDALFGSGLSKPLKDEYSNIINGINNTKGTVISIDIPSGLFADKTSVNNKYIVKATETVTFQVPKYAFFMPSNYIYTGDIKVIDINLHPNYFKSVKTDKFLITDSMCSDKFPIRKKFDHKGTYGHALIVAGSTGKPGAAVLSSAACLRSGAGMVTVCIPEFAIPILHTALPEIMSLDTKLEDANLSGFKTFAIGPGLGTDKHALSQLKTIIKSAVKNNTNLIIDADGLNLIGKQKQLLEQLPENTIITPHPKEYERMFGKSKDDFIRLEQQIEISKKHKLIIVYKTANTVISLPDGTVYINNTGNPGMATAGSGDVLTGIICGLMTSGMSPKHATIVGVYIHGLAGDKAAETLCMESITAGDIMFNIAFAIKEVNQYAK